MFWTRLKIGTVSVITIQRFLFLTSTWNRSITVTLNRHAHRLYSCFTVFHLFWNCFGIGGNAITELNKIGGLS